MTIIKSYPARKTIILFQVSAGNVDIFCSKSISAAKINRAHFIIYIYYIPPPLAFSIYHNRPIGCIRFQINISEAY
ncbi:hypothetical protein ACHZNU_004751, partial [Salmonella enterica]